MSNNLNLSQVAAAQNQKEVTINDQAGQLDAALTEVLTIEVDDTNAYVLTADQYRRHFFIVVAEGSPAPTAAIVVQVPAIRRGLFKLLNLTNQTVSVEVAGQSEPAPQIPAGENRMLSCDGSDVRTAGIGAPDLGSASIGELLDVDISGVAAGQRLSWNGTALVPVTEPFDVGLDLPDLSTAGALLAEVVLARPVDFPAAFAGSTAYARVTATGETVLDVQKNGSAIGTVTFAAASSTPVFAPFRDQLRARRPPRHRQRGSCRCHPCRGLAHLRRHARELSLGLVRPQLALPPKDHDRPHAGR